MSDERFSQNKKRYFTLDFSNVTEAGLKDLITSFNKAKAKVVETIASNRKAKKDGLFQKRAQFIFENGQSVTVTVGEQGDIVQTKLNTTVIPVSDSGTIDAYAKDVVMTMDKNQVSFEKALARKAAAAIKDTSDVKPASRPLAARIAEVQSAISAANSNIDAEKLRLAAANNVLNKNSSELEALKTKLGSLKSEENGLVEAIRTLEDNA